MPPTPELSGSIGCLSPGLGPHVRVLDEAVKYVLNNLDALPSFQHFEIRGHVRNQQANRSQVVFFWGSGCPKPKPQS